MSRGSNQHHEALTAERAVNEDYVEYLRSAYRRALQTMRSVSRPRNHFFTSPNEGLEAISIEPEPLIGRVALDEPNEDVGQSFYVGRWGRPGDDADPVVHWWSPYAKYHFYKGDVNPDLAGQTAVGRRTFVPRGDDIEDFEDEGDTRLFALEEELSVPERGALDATTSHQLPEHVELRAKGAVFAILQRPKTGQLDSLLATLQADQYELITWPEDVPLVVEGGPGTGKTVVAVHRAAYLAEKWREEGFEGTVMLVGPSAQYTDHVRHSLGKLTIGDVWVTSVNELLTALARLSEVPKEYRGEHEKIATSRDLGQLVDATTGQLRLAGRIGRGPGRDRETLYKELRSRSSLVRSLVSNEELWPWLGDLGSLPRAEKFTRLLPFLASIGVAASADPSIRYHHLIVDEGQDVRPLEWRVFLERLVLPGHVTILGDLNQRRSDFTSSTWDELAVDAGLDVGGVQPEVRSLKTGYRTTRQIMRFADQLLPLAQRTEIAIQDGTEPLVVKVNAAALFRRAIDEAIQLAERYPAGQIAVITLQPKDVSDEFRRRNWTRPLIPEAWTSDGITVLVLEPNRARGLEFDGVVVVEPSAFPSNYGRRGLLYTSLTRAVRALTIVHSRPLPPDLRSLR